MTAEMVAPVWMHTQISAKQYGSWSEDQCAGMGIVDGLIVASPNERPSGTADWPGSWPMPYTADLPAGTRLGADRPFTMQAPLSPLAQPFAFGPVCSRGPAGPLYRQAHEVDTQ